jgi:hypothetical protein
MKEEILEHAAKAFFASAWADYQEEYGDVNLSGCKILDVMPDVCPSAIEAAEKLITEVEKEIESPT